MAFQPHSFMFQPLDDDDHEHTNMVSSSNPNNTNNNILCHGGSGGQYSPFTMMKRSMSFSDHHQLQGGGDEDFSDEGSQIGEKKKRLNVDQVKTLEKSFEIGNKLEPERKLQLANALGLQPRQVAIWFQNRRARWKTKQLEKDYDVLSKQLDLLKADNQSLQALNKKLHAQLSALKGRDSSETGQEDQMKIDKGDQGSWSNGSDQNSSDINLDISRNTQVLMNNNNNNNNTTSNNSSSSSQLVLGKNLFPSNLRPSSITQLLQSSSRADLHGLKVDHPHHQLLQQQSDHENFCNLFVNNNSNNNHHHHGSTPAAVDQADHHQGTGFWTWPPEQHYFH